MQIDTVTTASHEWQAGTHDGQAVRDLMATHHFRGEHAVENTASLALLAGIAVSTTTLGSADSAGGKPSGRDLMDAVSPVALDLLVEGQDTLPSKLARAFLAQLPDAGRHCLQTRLDVHGHAMMQLLTAATNLGLLAH